MSYSDPPFSSASYLGILCAIQSPVRALSSPPLQSEWRQVRGDIAQPRPAQQPPYIGIPTPYNL